MKYRLIGKTNPISISEISLGCWTIGGPNWREGHPVGWAAPKKEEVAEAINYALSQGVNHFDNADTYGDGNAERLLSEILGARSKEVTIASKVGWLKGSAAHAYEPAHIRHQCEQSLINLNRDYLDIYYFHHADFGPNDCYLEPALEEMNNLKKQGKIRMLGLSAYSTSDFLRLIPKIQPEVIQSWANLTDDRFIADKTLVRQLIEKEKIAFIAFSPLSRGILLDRYDPQNPPKFEPGDHRSKSEKFSASNLAKVHEKLEKLKARFGQDTKELVRIALQYILHYPVVGSVIPGFRNKQQVEMNLAISGQELTGSEIEAIKKIFKTGAA